LKTSLPYFFIRSGRRLEAEVDQTDHRSKIAVVLARREGVGQEQLPDLVDIMVTSAWRGFRQPDRYRVRDA
jgi:hypothetical protein